MKKGDLVRHVYTGRWALVLAVEPIDIGVTVPHLIWNVFCQWIDGGYNIWVPLANVEPIDYHEDEELMNDLLGIEESWAKIVDYCDEDDKN